MHRKNFFKGISPIIAVVLLIMIVIGMGITTYYYLSKTQQTIQTGTTEQTEEAYKLTYTKIIFESLTPEKIYIRLHAPYEINSSLIRVYVDEELYNFTIDEEILRPNEVYSIKLSPSIPPGEHKVKITIGVGVEEERRIKVPRPVTTTTSIPITITTTTIPPGVTTTTTTLPSGVTTTTLPNTPPVVTPVSFSGSTTQGSVVTFMTNATDNEQSSSSLNVRLWVGRCNYNSTANCTTSSAYTWILNNVSMTYYAGNEFRYQWTINQPAGSIIGATCQAIDNQGATSNWGDKFPIFTVGVQPTTTTLTTTTSTTSTTTTTTISWYFSNLPKRRAINVTNSGSALTNYQLALNISYSSSMTYNFADLRFTYFNGSAEQQIPYWLETYQANSWAKVWVKVPSIPSGTSRLYVYYGNSSLLSESNFDQVFTKNFEDSDLVGLWHFDEGSGTSVSDASGNGNNGNIINQNLGTYWVASDGGQWDGRSDVKFSTGASINFTNAFSFVEVPHSSSLNLQNAITIEAWVNPRAIGGSFSYRRPITITNTAGALTDYQVLVTLDTASLISQGKMRSDCGDIRFTDPSVNSPLNYWIETNNAISPILIIQGDDDFNTGTRDANCGANPTFKYYYCTHPCEPLNWFTTSFDDSSWPSGVTPFGAQSVYTSACTNVLTSAPDDLFIRKWFTISGGAPISGRLYLSHDDGIRCYINGNIVVDVLGTGGVASYWNRIVEIPGSYLVKGNNLLACWVANGGENSGAGGGYLDIRLEVTVSTCDSSNTRIWVRVPSIPVGSKTIYMYYGNPSATSMSDGKNTFYIFEDWETGSIDTNYWSMRGSVSPAWKTYWENKYQGSYSAGNSKINDGQYVELYKIVNFPMRWRIDYYWSVSSEANKDFLRFWMDGYEYAIISGSVGWTLRSFTDISSGSHTLVWRYDKDASGSAGSDTGWVDYIIARGYANPEPSLTLGEETPALMIAKGNAYGLGANTTDAFSFINGVRISTSLSSGWNHIVMTAEYIAGVMQQKLYVNSVHLQTQTVSGTINTNTNPLMIFNPGILDEVRIYNRALSEGEIRAHYYRKKYASVEPSYVIGSEETK
ncbi:MAG: DUF2341 domain-containing protein [Candidatus Aenigmarchaeota archaeon]|nr:DUF2341 domain-containing protein [Candidatus Aenigmarchaeota archaeon]